MPPESTAPSPASSAKAPAGAAAAAQEKEKAARDKAAKEKAASAAAESNIKETVESILVAFILAFIFRAFVVEAFVIPTGSMAPTLMGAHMRFRCPDCGYAFDVNFSNGARGDDLQIPDYAAEPNGNPIVYGTPPYPRNGDRRTYFPAINCPNCGHVVPNQSAADPENDGASPPVFYGDRILVLKYLYLFQKPQRWDVVVFKAPVADVTPGPHGEAGYHYTENYIKRLVGLPGETVVIVDGDVYTRAPGSNEWEIRRKPYSVQKDLWRNVYDNDFIPRLPNGWVQPWMPDGGTGWTLTQGAAPSRAFTFHNPSGEGRLNFDPTANPKTHALTDWLAYDQGDPRNPDPSAGLYPVSDLLLTCAYQRQSGDGAFSLQLVKGADTFTARITPGRAQLVRVHGGDKEQVIADERVADLEGSRPAELEFANCDYRLWLRVNGRSVFEKEYEPDWWGDRKADDWPTTVGSRTQPGGARILAEKQDARIEHVRLARDIYYINQGKVSWGTPARPITLKDSPNEYFVLGDNSRISGDARTWQEGVYLPAEKLDVEAGRVPEQFMLGKAFFVYWPAGYRPFSKSTGQGNPYLNPGLVPNFGDMRSIH